MPQPITISQLSLQVGNHGADRGILVGRAGSGKSTLAAALIEDFHRRYCLGVPREKAGRVLVIDTKPRWRAEQMVTGASTRRQYRKFVKGDLLRHSVVLTDGDQWDMAFDPDINSRLVIAQRNDLPHREHIRWQVGNIARFFDTQDAKYPSLLYVDEGMDFFGPTGMAHDGDALQRCYRAGREKALATLIGVQRPRAINLQCLTESNVLYLFAINFDEDVKRLREMGFPKDIPPPRENYRFLFFRDGKLFHKPLQIRKAA